MCAEPRVASRRRTPVAVPLGLDGSSGYCDHGNGQQPNQDADGPGEPRGNVDGSELLVLF